MQVIINIDEKDYQINFYINTQVSMNKENVV